MSIVVDAMGGDDAPGEIVKGIALASLEYDKKIILTGPKKLLESELEKYEHDSKKISIQHAPEVIGMGDTPARAIRKKKDSSIVVAARMVKEGKAEAFVSAGNTGAVMAASTLVTGRIKGIDRPAIATIFPALKGETLVLDVGANVDSTPKNLLQQAWMGQLYSKQLMGKSNPKVALLSVGEEEKKGNKLTREATKLLKEESNLNFVGNAEGRDIFTGEYDIIICDGFVGNVVLKMAEGLSDTIFKVIKREIKSSILSKIGGLLLKPAFKRVAKSLDYTEYGGAPLLGIDGITIIGHGSSNAKAIKNAVRAASESIDAELVNSIKANLEGRNDG